MVTSVAPASRPRAEQPQPSSPPPMGSGSPIPSWVTRSRVLIAAAVIVVLAALAWYFLGAKPSGATAFRFGAVQRGDVQQTVQSTGALSAVKTVQVGTQVSGKVVALFVDFNDRVTQGQLLARIDPTLQQQAVTDAQAQLSRAQAQLAQARDEYNRNLPLFQEKFISASEFGTVQVNLSVAQAQVKSAQVTLERARQNLSYTNIYAPINGVVVERNVDAGQTVAASFSAPQLFLIAQDLSQMQIIAAVDESDISSIKNGQEVRFTVQSYGPGRTFTGTVQQVRLQSTTTDNVVSYSVVVSVQNPEGLLLPGMTATVDFVTGSAKNVLTVPNAALRFRPRPEELAAAGLPENAGQDTSRRRAGAGGSTGAARRATGAGGQGGQGAFGGGQGGQPGPGGQGARPRTRSGGPGTLWTVDATGKLEPVRVRTGLSDGQHTQISSQNPIVKEGMKVIIGSSLASEGTEQASQSPLTPQRRGRGF